MRCPPAEHHPSQTRRRSPEPATGGRFWSPSGHSLGVSASRGEDSAMTRPGSGSESACKSPHLSPLDGHVDGAAGLTIFGSTIVFSGPRGSRDALLVLAAPLCLARGAPRATTSRRGGLGRRGHVARRAYGAAFFWRDSGGARLFSKRLRCRPTNGRPRPRGGAARRRAAATDRSQWRGQDH
jgi:hypothetical protein